MPASVCIDRGSVRFLQIKDTQDRDRDRDRWPHPPTWLVCAPMDYSPVHLFRNLCGFNYLWLSAKAGYGSFGPCAVHLGHGPAVSLCAVGLLPMQNSAPWQGHLILAGWRRCSVATWENVRWHREPSKCFERGSLSQNHQSEPVISPAVLNIFRGEQIEDLPCRVGLSEGERKEMLLDAPERKWISRAPVSFHSNHCVCLWDSLTQWPPF